MDEFDILPGDGLPRTDIIIDSYRRQIAELQAEIERLRNLNECLEQLLACYRIGKRPSEKILNKITELKTSLGKDQNEKPTRQN